MASLTHSRMRAAVGLYTKEVAGTWYGVACVGEALAATAAGSTRAGVLGSLRRSLPQQIAHELVDEDGSEYAEATIALLVELEAGDEARKSFALASDLIAEPLASVLKLAAAIPVGYVSSYGDIAKASGAEARDVGGIMASNPLYPIVACHRVVGADLSLTGYRGSRGSEALREKLARLSREARGFKTEKDVTVEGRRLRVYPVEWAIAKAERRGTDRHGQRSLFE